MIKNPLLKLTFLMIVYFLSTSTSFALIINPAIPITHTVTVQPIIVSDDDGGNTANYFGSPAEESSITGLIDQIWAQAGIDIVFLAANTWNNTFANWGAGGAPDNGGNTRPTTDLSTIVTNGAASGVTNANPNILNMFFVRIAAGFGLLSDNYAAGLAFRPGNGVTQFVGTNLLGFLGGQEAIAGVVAHEIGHNLGLPHTNDGSAPEGLMTSGGSGDRLTSAQKDLALTSNLAVAAVPLPAAFWFLASGLLILFRINKKAFM